MSRADWTFHEGGLDTPDVAALIADHFAEMRAISPPEACNVLPADKLRDPTIRFFSVRDKGGALLGFGALKTLEPGHCEIKSMRTTRAALGKGVGRAVLDHLLSTARAMGMARISLETGNSEHYHPANRLYLSAGFQRCGPFGGYADTPFTLFYTRSL